MKSLSIFEHLSDDSEFERIKSIDLKANRGIKSVLQYDYEKKPRWRIDEMFTRRKPFTDYEDNDIYYIFGLDTVKKGTIKTDFRIKNDNELLIVDNTSSNHTSNLNFIKHMSEVDLVFEIKIGTRGSSDNWLSAKLVTKRLPLLILKE